MSKAHHPENKFERKKIAVKKENNGLSKKEQADRRNARVWKKLSEESLKEWEARYELEQVAYRKDSSKDP